MSLMQAYMLAAELSGRGTLRARSRVRGWLLVDYNEFKQNLIK